MYGLAAREEQDENSERFMNIARGITNTCHESYIRSDTKVDYVPYRVSHLLVDLGLVSFDFSIPPSGPGVPPHLPNCHQPNQNQAGSAVKH